MPLLPQDVKDLLKADPGYFLGFTLIIAVNLSASLEEDLSSLLWSGTYPSLELVIISPSLIQTSRTFLASDMASSTTTALGAHPDIPLILVRSAGFMGTVRVQVREHTSQWLHSKRYATLADDALYTPPSCRYPSILLDGASDRQPFPRFARTCQQPRFRLAWFDGARQYPFRNYSHPCAR